MRIADVLRTKGTMVATVEPRTTVSELLALLALNNIGAMVVTDPQGVVGIVSERDVVRSLHEHGPALLTGPVSRIMTTAVVTCSPQDTVDRVMDVMTERRVRHIPVVADGLLRGIVSIGDVVKNRINQLEQDSRHLADYIAQGS
ncbi:CBS domain-containing protein [Pseudonocardiaceae bacterium YIM PH 21723]|nr:CBS domain-containing protein [Pseudonocardiaceae bacterium YIM PH 21723]